MIAVPIRDAWPILTEQEREKLAAWRREGGMAAAALRLDLEHLAQQAAEAVELAAKLRDPGAAQAARNIVQSFVRLDALLDVLAGFEKKMLAAERSRQVQPPPVQKPPADDKAAPRPGPTHPDFLACVIAVDACHELAKRLASAPHGPLTVLGLALGEIAEARQPDVLRFNPNLARQDRATLGALEAKARAWAVLAMEALLAARKAGAGNKRAEDAARIADALDAAAYRRTPAQVAKWREKFAPDLRAIVEKREKTHTFAMRGAALETLRNFATHFFAPTSAKRPSDATGWLRLAETLEAEIRKLAGAGAPRAPKRLLKKGSGRTR